MRQLLTAILLACAPFGAATAQGFAQYAVKIVCGAPDHPAVAPGFYYTAINIHNPAVRTGAKARWKVSLTLPKVTPGQITTFAPIELRPDSSVEIECRDIIARLREVRFAKGYVVIQSDVELDVVGVYTAAASPQGSVVAFELERVPVRRVSQ